MCVCLEGEIRLVRYTGTESELQESVMVLVCRPY